MINQSFNPQVFQNQYIYQQLIVKQLLAAQQFQLLQSLYYNQMAACAQIQIQNQNHVIQAQSTLNSQDHSVEHFREPSTRKIIKLDKGVEVVPIKIQNNHHKTQDYEQKVEKELHILIKYLTDEPAPSDLFLQENFKLLHDINSQLVSLIANRHLSQRKTKEEQIKFVLRKCFKYLKGKMDINLNVSPIDIEKQFYKIYFNGDEDMIPFRVRSSMKTMNTQYIKKIFNSQQFVNGYKEYLQHFDEIWEEENHEKRNNMVKQVMKIINSGKINSLNTYRRIPWVVSIKDKCFELANCLLQYTEQGTQIDHKQL